MSKPRRTHAKASGRFSALINPQELLDGPTETMSASVPEPLLAFVRERSSDRGFSQVVTKALFFEAVRLAREEFVKDVEDATGPLDPERVEAAQRILRS